MDYVSSMGISQATFLLFLPEPLLSRLLTSGPASVCMQQPDSHLSLVEGLLSPSTLGVPATPGLVFQPDFRHHCSRDVVVFHVAQVRTEFSREGYQSQMKDGGLLGLPNFLT